MKFFTFLFLFFSAYALIAQSQIRFFGGTVNNSSCTGELNGSYQTKIIGGSPFTDAHYLISLERKGNLVLEKIIVDSLVNGETAILPNLAAGRYHLIAQDSSGQIADITFTIRADLRIDDSGFTTSTANAGTDSSSTRLNVRVNFSSESITTGWNFHWENLQGDTLISVDASNQSTLSNLSPGTYTVTVTNSDFSGCQFVRSYIIEDKTIEFDYLERTGESCIDKQDGVIRFKVNGGEPFTDGEYKIDLLDQDGYPANANSTIGRTVNQIATIENLTSKNHRIRITDGRGRTRQDRVALIPQKKLTLAKKTIKSITPTNELGEIKVELTTIGAPLEGTIKAQWQNHLGESFPSIDTANTSTLQIGQPGKYTVQITDEDTRSCTFEQSYYLDNGNVDVTSAMVKNATCDGNNDGSIIMERFPIIPFPDGEFIINIEDVIDSIRSRELFIGGLSPNTYHVNIIGANAVITDTIVIEVDQPFLLKDSLILPSFPTASDGELYVTATMPDADTVGEWNFSWQTLRSHQLTINNLANTTAVTNAAAKYYFLSVRNEAHPSCELIKEIPFFTNTQSYNSLYEVYPKQCGEETSTIKFFQIPFFYRELSSFDGSYLVDLVKIAPELDTILQQEIFGGSSTRAIEYGTYALKIVGRDGRSVIDTFTVQSEIAFTADVKELVIPPTNVSSDGKISVDAVPLAGIDTMEWKFAWSKLLPDNRLIPLTTTYSATNSTLENLNRGIYNLALSNVAHEDCVETFLYELYDTPPDSTEVIVTDASCPSSSDAILDIPMSVPYRLIPFDDEKYIFSVFFLERDSLSSIIDDVRSNNIRIGGFDSGTYVTEVIGKYTTEYDTVVIGNQRDFYIEQAEVQPASSPTATDGSIFLRMGGNGEIDYADLDLSWTGVPTISSGITTYEGAGKHEFSQLERGVYNVKITDRNHPECQIIESFSVPVDSTTTNDPDVPIFPVDSLINPTNSSSLTQLFPNPAQQSIQIKYESAFTERVDYQIFNSLGQVVKMGASYPLEVISIAELPTGVYQWVAIIDNQRVVVSFSKI